MSPAVAARYAAALAAVEVAETRAATLALPRFAACRQPFVASDRRQEHCRRSECVRARKTRAMRRWRLHRAALLLDRTPIGRSSLCPCGARLEVYVRPTGEVLDYCPECRSLRPTRRAV